MTGTAAPTRSGASPGGPAAASAAKRRRLASLDDIMGTGRQQRQQPPASASAAGNAGASQPATVRRSARGAAAAPAPLAAAPPAAATAAPARLEFPYAPLAESVLDGSLSAALAQAKAAGAAAAAATSAVTVGPSPAPTPVPGRQQHHRRAAAPPSVAAAGAAAAAATAAGGDSVAAELLALFVSTNPRASGSDMRSLLTQRLQDRSVMLDNPTAPVKASRMFARRGSSYSAKLRSNAARKASMRQQQGGRSERVPSYETMMRVHQLWKQYAASTAPGGGGAGTTAAAGGAGSRPSADLAAGQLDLHGALVTVVRHVDPQHVGVSGVVLRCSAECVHVVTRGDRLRVVPLKGSTLQYAANATTLQLSN